MVSKGIVAVAEFFPASPFAGGTFESGLCYVYKHNPFVSSTHACLLHLILAIFSIQLVNLRKTITCLQFNTCAHKK
jgi:hypothetical protein